MNLFWHFFLLRDQNTLTTDYFDTNCMILPKFHSTDTRISSPDRYIG